MKAEVINGLIEQKLLSLHTAFLAKVTAFDEDSQTATVQPLAMVKQFGKAAQMQALITDVIYLKSTRPAKKTDTVGDTVLCVCCERDISQTKKGIVSLPAVGHHQMHDCIIVGVI